jgi:hypothetical protein
MKNVLVIIPFYRIEKMKIKEGSQRKYPSYYGSKITGKYICNNWSHIRDWSCND